MNRLILPLAFLTALSATAQTPVRYGTGLDSTGSKQPVHTIFTNPGADCSQQVNISWATPTTIPTSEVEIRRLHRADTTWHMAAVSTGTMCTTFDSIRSKLGDNSDVFERHIFMRHGATLTGLTPSTTYEYRIVAKDSDQTFRSEARRFKTAGDTAWRAAVIGDFHHYSPLWRRLDASMAMLDTLDSVAGGYDWVLSTGDQCAWGGSYNYWTELAEQPAYKSHMWGAVQGNHDHMSRDKQLTDAYFRDTHRFPDNGYAGQEGVCYSFRYGDVLFIMLNNEAMRTAESLVPVHDWIRQTANASDAKYKVVVEHYEWLIGTDGRYSQLRRFADLFTEVGIDLAVSGNNHAYLRTHQLRGDSVSDDDTGTYYVVTPSSDDSRGRDLNPVVANEDLIATRWSEGPKTVGAMILDVTPSRLIMTLYDRHGNIHDTFTIAK